MRKNDKKEQIKEDTREVDRTDVFVKKCLKHVQDAVEIEVGSKPDYFEELDIRCEVWKALEYLKNFFK